MSERGPERDGERRPRGRVERGRAPLVLVVLIAALGACDGVLGDDPSTGLEVSVTRGPIEPVAREGEPNSAPVQNARVRIEAVDGGSAEFRTNGNGRVRAPLVPGEYAVTVETCPGAISLPRPAAATVVRGSIAPVDLECDTGIR